MDNIILGDTELSTKETMHYRKIGKGENVFILIHGHQSSSVFFEDIIKEIKVDFTIYAIDLVGFGNSSYNRQHIEIKDWADDVASFMEMEGINKAVVLGWSFGGGVAMELAANYPNKVEKLILLSSVGVKGYPMFNYEKLYENFKNKDRTFIRKSWEKAVFNINRPNKRTFNEYIDGILQEACYMDCLKSLFKFNITKENGTGRIENIKIPVYWIHGEKDLVISCETGRESIMYFNTEKKFVLFKNSGHMIFFDEKEKFLNLIENILKNKY